MTKKKTVDERLTMVETKVNVIIALLVAIGASTWGMVFFH